MSCPAQQGLPAAGYSCGDPSRGKTSSGSADTVMECLFEQTAVGVPPEVVIVMIPGSEPSCRREPTRSSCWTSSALSWTPAAPLAPVGFELARPRRADRYRRRARRDAGARPHPAPALSATNLTIELRRSTRSEPVREEEAGPNQSSHRNPQRKSSFALGSDILCDEISMQAAGMARPRAKCDSSALPAELQPRGSDSL